MVDPKPRKRVKDPKALRNFALRAHECAACGTSSGNLSIHHVVRKGAPHFGDDVKENFLILCGDGTRGCHGEFHAGDKETAAAIGRALEVEHLRYVEERVGVGWREWLRRTYLLEVEEAAV